MKKKIIIITSIIVVVIALFIFAFYMFTTQYNMNGVSHFLVVSIDNNVERKKIGKLEGYNVYIEGFKKYNFRVFLAKDLSLEKAINGNLVSIDEWKKYAIGTKKDNDSLILLFENYEISLTFDECLIKPRIH